VKIRTLFYRKSFCGYLLLLLVIACVEPTDPEFELREGLIFVDSFLTTTPGNSFVTISESVLLFERFRRTFIGGANVEFRNTNTNTLIPLVEQEGIYLPPPDFVGSVGESWELQITLADGRQYRSLPERIIPSVPILEVSATFNPDLIFRPTNNQFVPGHSVSVDFADPPNEENFYFWSFRSFEHLVICESCENGIFRNGECEPNPIGSNRRDLYEYECDSDCWFIRTNESISVFSDEFSNGRIVNALPVADIVLFSRENIVVQLQQFSLTASAYEYYRILQDLVDNNAGINAPPPAALIGNMFNPNDDQEFVLGRFTAAAATAENIFIDRRNIQEQPVNREIFFFEGCNEVCPAINCPPTSEPGCVEVLEAPCEETRFKTGITPEGWVDLE